MKEGILLVAFGSSSEQGVHALRAFNATVHERFCGVNTRWAFTSLILRERLAKEKVKRDSVLKALQKMHFEKYTHVAVQPLQTIPGTEHLNLLDEVCQFTKAQKDVSVFVGAPLLQEEIDVQNAAQAMLKHLPEERQSDESVIFMGHGALHPAVKRYADLAHAVSTLDAHVHVGTMDGACTLESILPKLNAGKKVWLMPLLSVIGQHALEDMAGKQNSSWRSQIEAAGFVCEPVLRGIAEYEGFIDIWISHLNDVMSIMRKQNERC